MPTAYQTPIKYLFKSFTAFIAFREKGITEVNREIEVHQKLHNSIPFVLYLTTLIVQWTLPGNIFGDELME